MKKRDSAVGFASVFFTRKTDIARRIHSVSREQELLEWKWSGRRWVCFPAQGQARTDFGYFPYNMKGDKMNHQYLRRGGNLFNTIMCSGVGRRCYTVFDITVVVLCKVLIFYPFYTQENDIRTLSLVARIPIECGI